jgi:hypothetical protein
MNEKYKKETEIEYILGLIKRGKVTNLNELCETQLLQHHQEILLAISCKKFDHDENNYVTKLDLRDAAKKINKNKHIMLNAIICGYCLSWVDNELLNDRNFVLDAIKRGAEPIPEKYENDREIIKAYIKYDGLRLKDLSHTFKDDINLIKIALKYDRRILKHIDQKWINDVDFIKYLVSIHPDFLRYASDKVLTTLIKVINNNDNP